MKKGTNILMVFLLVISATLHAQTLSTKNKKAIELYQNADNYRVRGQYNEAIKLLNDAIQKDKEFEEAYYRLATVYRAMEDFPDASMILEEGITKVKDPLRRLTYHFDLSDFYLRQGKYEESLKHSVQFLNSGKTDLKRTATITLRKTQAEYAIVHKDSILSYKISPLSDTVNKFPMQYFPVITGDEQQLIFTARFGEGRNENEDLVISIKNKNGSWSKPVSLSDSINSIRREGACTISADGRHLIYTVCGERGCDLYESRKTGLHWSKPRSLGPNVNSTSWDAQPSLSADGRELYFVSDRKGGLGEYDIWYTRLESTGWTKAVNLGASVNTPFSEISPYIHVNNQTLYVVSNGYPGYGGYDIYQVNKSEKGWAKPFNMGKPLNDHFDQYSFIVSGNGNTAFYSREVSRNRSRLFQIELPEQMVVKSKGNFVKGKITDSKSLKPLRASIELFDLTNNSQVSLIESDSVSGEYLIVLPGGSEYALYVSKPGYLFNSMNFNYLENDRFQPVHIDFSLARIVKDASIVLNNIFFDYDKYELKEKSVTELEEVVSFLRSNPTIAIEIGGHTDSQGKEDYNQQLSLKRADAVAKFIQSKGIDPGRLRVVGYGSQSPRVPNNTETNRALNRRIEFRVR